MDGFEAAFQHIIVVEGMAYTNRPSDRGGPTRYGITQRTYSTFLGRQATEGDVRAMTMATAKVIYRRFYWDTLSLGQFPPKIALALFDQSVNRGPYYPTIALQKALGITQDGKIGSKTIAAVKKADERKLIFQFCKESIFSYVRIMQNSPEQLEYGIGWTARALNLIESLALS